MNTTTDAIALVCTAQATIDTPLGPIRLARTARGLAGAWFAGQKHHPAPFAAPESPDDPLLRQAAAQLADYFGDAPGRAFDLPLDLIGTPFQRAVWTALQAIPAGTLRSYGEIARALGAVHGFRAVGAAVGRNPVSVIVPCHRVVGSDGAMTGYAGGLDRKIELLRREGARRAVDVRATTAGETAAMFA